MPPSFRTGAFDPALRRGRWGDAAKRRPPQPRPRLIVKRGRSGRRGKSHGVLSDAARAEQSALIQNAGTPDVSLSSGRRPTPIS
ncbi:hypothetical protein EVAR_37703_1 [Eumeta japonica]|uniref:Uncharacterized protein n=1 Tax=Eumeta variegata TaxID=151549 RepID=A0A4C1XV81_EUMVA|nr:hypothetical protein EVAR_37703_1 [Eumeta japonica]